MTRPAAKNPLKHLRPSDARAIAQLATHATTGITDIAEGVHQSVWGSLGAKGDKTPGTTGGMTGLIYQAVRGVTALLGKGVDLALTRLQPLFDAAEQAQPETPQREAVLAALNGVMGDRLAASGNSLATRMTLRYQGRALDWRSPSPMPQARSKVLVLIHGLCMNDLQWQTRTAGPAGAIETGPAQSFDHGAELASALGYSPVYVRYNTGLHTSQNGHELAHQLEQLRMFWPVPVEEITVLAHSMGGLVVRGAVHFARQDGLQWPGLLRNIVFLGTPHHGAPLERAGNWIDVILGSTPYSAPFARLGQLRSAGITDLRYGHVLDTDWQGHDRFRRKPDSRQHLPLPEGVACFAVAATTAPKRGLLADRLIGDGLVPLHSALGQHDDPRRNLVFARASQQVVYRTHHMQLLGSPEVRDQLLQWLSQ